MRRLALVIALGLAASAVWAATVATAASDTVGLTNAERVAQNLRPLVPVADLNAAAQQHAEEMAAAEAIWHTPDLAHRVTGWKRVGENVGRGPTIEAVHNGFMASPTHRENILQPAYTQMGVGMATGADRVYISVLFRQPLPRTTARPATPLATVTAAAVRPVAEPQPVRVKGATITRSAESALGGRDAAASLPVPRPIEVTGLAAVAAALLVVVVGAQTVAVARASHRPRPVTRARHRV
jgi:hypothetical protein